MYMTASRAFIAEIRAQHQAALDERARAASARDDAAVAEATGRLRDLEELARRNDAWPWREALAV